MVQLMNRARLILTDSGGVSKESSFAGAKCLFMLDLDVWPDLLKDGWIRKVDPQNAGSVSEALAFAQGASRVASEDRPKYYGDGHAAAKIVDALRQAELI